jgi:tRNA A-37 threonylcarbamoyl transferase component Bud32
MAIGADVLGNRYEIGRLIGAGGMADVYEGFDRLLGRQVAIKIPHPQLARDPAFLARFRREASMAASLTHPGVVAVYDTGQDDDVSYMVMEYVEGATLAAVLRAEGALEPGRAAELAMAVCSALGAAHAKGLIHRDVKPSNIMIAQDGRAKVMDFGVARTVTSSVTLTGSVGIVGTAKYMSPEQASGSQVDARSDLYSLGVCLYECLAGQPPFEGDSPVVVATRHVYATPPPLRDLRPDLPPAFEAVTARAMAKDPADRYQTAGEFTEDLRSAHAGQAVAMPGPAEPVAPLTGPGPTARQPAARPGAVPGGRAPGRWPRALLRWPVVLGLAVVVGVGMFVAGWPPSYDRAQGGPSGGGFQADAPGPGQVGASTTTASTLPEGRPVPNVLGMTLARARQALAAAGFDPDQVTVTRRTSTGPPNLVLDQSPRAPALARDGEITLTVSREAAPLPTTSTPPTTSTRPTTSTSTSTTSTTSTTTTSTTTTTLAPTET